VATWDLASRLLSYSGADGAAGGADQRYYVYLPDGSLRYSLEAADNTRHFSTSMKPARRRF
jgi:hypothetical protein